LEKGSNSFTPSSFFLNPLFLPSPKLCIMVVEKEEEDEDKEGGVVEEEEKEGLEFLYCSIYFFH
jgi:hypothetical protein